MAAPLKIAWRGRLACQCLIDFMDDFEYRVLKGGRVTTWQASYSDADASKGTHRGGGAWDGPPMKASRIKAMRRRGGFASARFASQGFDSDHTHLVICGCPHLSEAAARQVADYRAGTNGLLGQGKDQGPRDFVDVTWRSYKKERRRWLATKGKTLVIRGKPYKPVSAVSVAWINRARRAKVPYVSRHVYWLQVWLRQAGYYLAPQDGEFGQVTQAALNGYRRRELGLTGADAVGPIELATLNRLRNQAGSALKTQGGK